MRGEIRSWTGRALQAMLWGGVLTVAMGASDCAPYVTAWVQPQIDAYWSDPAKRNSLQAQANTAINNLIYQNRGQFAFDYKVLKISYASSSVTTNLGTVPPVYSTVANSVVSGTSSGNTYLGFNFNLDWNAGNGATITAKTKLNVQGPGGLISFKTPSFDLVISDIQAHLAGGMLALVSSANPAAASWFSQNNITYRAELCKTLDFGIGSYRFCFNFDPGLTIRDSMLKAALDSAATEAIRKNAGAFGL